MASLAQRAMSGALKVIRECLGLRHDTPLVIFCDETSSAVAELIELAAKKLRVPVRLHLEPLEKQRDFQSETGLPPYFHEYIDECQGVITCFAADPAATSFRLELIGQATQRDKRVGHMPGVSLNVLAYAVNIDYTRVQQKCDDLAFALTVGSRSRLTTYGGDDEAESLELDLGGLERSAVLSTGIVASGTWGNLPGGETFIAPIEGKAEGRFVLNGAFHAHVMRRRKALVLTFRNGRLTKVSSGAPKVVAKFEKLFERLDSKGAENWRTLAELGIGVNEGIRKLTGNSLFDEKCLGTVHIALGDNTTFGGRSKSDSHEDLVTLGPSLEVDGKPILDRGEYVFNSTQWREDITTYPVESSLLGNNTSVMKSLIMARVENSALIVERRISDGRINRYTVGNAHSTFILSAIYTEIPKGPWKIGLNKLHRVLQSRGLEIDRKTLMSGLSILVRHQLTAVTET